MKKHGSILLVAILPVAAAAAVACSSDSASDPPAPGVTRENPVQLAYYPLNAQAIPAGADAVFDPEVTRDGDGSLRVVTDEEGGRLRLYRVDGIGPIRGKLVYTGFLKSQDLRGAAYFELWCHPSEGDPAFVRGVARRVEASSDWKPQELSFSHPETCRNPAFVELNVVIHGAGTVWIDHIRLWDVPVE